MPTRQLGQSDLDITHGALDKRVHRGVEGDNFASSCCPGLAVPWPAQAHRICSRSRQGSYHRTVVGRTSCGPLILRALSPLLTTRAGKAAPRQRRKSHVGAAPRDRA